ncbi:ribosome biogenesis factor YjgA [Sulfurivermis fontis]|uniref:ribosome biogenesis factor YjgA n=1 Tax=Sulfurivermis fontis TaxID=1972068 RepID=UPI000FDC145F|nr:ribosome biogenesis factor YjgA [Sulfurivermis fontis]
MTHDDFDDADLGPSKSQLKRDAHELLDLGAALVELAPQQLAQIPLSETVLAAVKETRGITAHGARKRQLKYLGKLLRLEDDAPIREALERLQSRHALTVAHHHQCERWRDRLIAEGDAALTALLDEFPHADRQQLRQLMRAAQTEQAQGKPPKSARELFRALRALIG